MRSSHKGSRIDSGPRSGLGPVSGGMGFFQAFGKETFDLKIFAGVESVTADKRDNQWMMNPLSLLMHQILQKPNLRRYVRFGERTFQYRPFLKHTIQKI